MKINRILTLVLIHVCLGSSSFCYAQESYKISSEEVSRITQFPAPLNQVDFPFSPVTIDESTYGWAKLMYDADPNIYEVIELYDSWRKSHPDIKDNHTRNYRKLIGYLFLNDGIDEEGRIRLKTSKELEQLNHKLLTDRSKETQSKGNDKANSAAKAWRHLGPTFMKSTLGELVNRHINIYSITQCQSNRDVLYCTSESGATVYKSINRGDSWFSVSDDYIIDMGARNIEVAPSNPDVVYLCTKHDIYKSENGGTSWSSVYQSNNVQNLTLIIHPDNADTVIAGGNNGILRSHDGGDNWTVVHAASNVYDLRYQPGNTQVIYALVDNDNTKQTEFYKSIDGGESWTLKTTGWPSETSNSNIGGQMTTSDDHPHIIYAFIGATWTDERNEHNVKILKSSDAGETWTLKVDYDNPKGINSGQGYYDWDIEMSDVDSNIVAFGTQNSWISYDGLETVTSDMRHGWSGHADIQEMLFIGDEIWVVNDGGVIKYENDSLYNYEVKSVGIDAISYWGFDQGWNSDTWCGVHYHNGTSAASERYENDVAINFGGAEPHFALVSQPSADRVVSKGYGSVNGYEIPTEQSGEFSRFSYNIEPNKQYIYGNNACTDLQASDTHYVGVDNHVMKSIDFGLSWDTLSAVSSDSDDKIWDIQMTRDNPNMMFVSSFNSGDGKVFKSVDKGLNFSELSLPSAFDNRPTIMHVAVMDNNPDEIYIMGDRYGIKIAKSTDGGQTWIDLYTNTLNGYKGRDIMQVSGTDGGIYIVASRGVFYRNNTMTDWVLLSDGIPANTEYRFIQPFYRDAELRIATSRGIYAAELYDIPDFHESLLQPIVQKVTSDCKRDTMYFDDYSVVDHEGATWSWTFPGASYVSDLNSRNPKVLYQSDGPYDVTMSITKSGQTHTKTIEQMISISDQCTEIDPAPEQAIAFAGNTEHIVTEDFNLTTNRFSFTGWVKPKTALRAFSGIFSNGVWCAHCNDQTLGIEINYWGGHLWYRWPGSTSGWASRTTLAPVVDEWNFIAMVMSPDSVVMYLNDDKWVSHITHEPADIGQLYVGKGFYNKYLEGEVDEYSFWKKSLNDQEIRELMHMTKDPAGHPDLLAYYQFNETAEKVYDKAGIYHATLLDGASRVLSSVPVGKGHSSSQIEQTGTISYIEVGVSLDINSTNDGEIVISRIELEPFSIPVGYDSVFSQQYWTIHRYGSDEVNGSLRLRLSENLSVFDEQLKEDFLLLGRVAHGTGAWSIIDSSSMVDQIHNEVTFDTIPSYSQLLVARAKPFLCDNSIAFSNTTELPDFSGSMGQIVAGNINGTGDVQILSNQDKTFVAEQSIELIPGFVVEQNALFRAIIDDCPN